MNEIVGYCTIKKDAKTCRGAKKPEDFIGQTLRVFEFNPEGDVLVLNSKANAFAMFDAIDVHRKFECVELNDIVMPKTMKNDFMKQTIYVTKVMQRNGGYNNLLKQMVIQASLMKGEFSDNLLFAKQ